MNIEREWTNYGTRHARQEFSSVHSFILQQALEEVKSVGNSDDPSTSLRQTPYHLEDYRRASLARGLSDDISLIVLQLGAHVTSAPVSFWRPSHFGAEVLSYFGARFTLAPSTGGTGANFGQFKGEAPRSKILRNQ
uniref:Uncharacterized protein n=1 Tax=Romanomermis culicivorax TaxID=13658 RepID=A0A915KG73_ROMCU